MILSYGLVGTFFHLLGTSAAAFLCCGLKMSFAWSLHQELLFPETFTYYTCPSVTVHVGVIFGLCVHWLLLRSWVCGGQPAVCCRGWAAQRCQGKQVSVGDAAARPEAVHGENDTSPLLCLSSKQSKAWFMLSCTWEEGLITCPQYMFFFFFQCPGASLSSHFLLLPALRVKVSSMIHCVADRKVTVQRSADPESLGLFSAASCDGTTATHSWTSLNSLLKKSVLCGRSEVKGLKDEDELLQDRITIWWTA